MPDRQVAQADGMFFNSPCDKSMTISDSGQKSPCSPIGHLPDEMLLEIFDCCRRADEYGWNHRRQWYMLLHVCRKWRYRMLESASRLELRLLCTYQTPVAEMLLHTPPLPLIIQYDADFVVNGPHAEENRLLPFQHADRVCSIFVSGWHFGTDLRGQHGLLDKAFPALETLALSSEFYTTTPFPRNFTAPHLRSLILNGLSISVASPLLTNAANLISLRLQYIPVNNYGEPSPGYLVEVLSNLPRLKNLLIIYPNSPHDIEYMFRASRLRPISAPDQITRVVLPNVSTLIYAGVGLYLENLLALISTPLLQRFDATYHPHRHFTVPCLSEFLGTIHNLDFQRVEVSLGNSRSVTITYHLGPSSDTLSYLKFTIDEAYYGRREQVGFARQICRTMAPVHPILQDLTLEYRESGESPITYSPSHSFLLSLKGVTTLRLLQKNLAAELADALGLQPDNGVVIKELLPMLSELVVVCREDRVLERLVSFIDERRLAGHHIEFRVLEESWPSFSFPDNNSHWSFDWHIF